MFFGIHSDGAIFEAKGMITSTKSTLRLLGM